MVVQQGWRRLNDDDEGDDDANEGDQIDEDEGEDSSSSEEEEEEEGDESKVPFVKVVNGGEQLVMNRVRGYLAGQVSVMLANSYPHKRKIWLSRHGESQLNVLGRLGGDPPLTKKGFAYSHALAHAFRNQEKLTVYTSTLIRTHQTVERLSELKPHYKFHQTRLLNEIHAGECELMTYKEIQQTMPQEWKERQLNKFQYRYPKGGESYVDIVERLKPMIIELTRQSEPLLVVTHQAVMRILLSFFIDDLDQETSVHFEVPHNRLVELVPTGYGYKHRFIEVDIEPWMAKVGEDEVNMLPPTPEVFRRDSDV